MGWGLLFFIKSGFQAGILRVFTGFLLNILILYSFVGEFSMQIVRNGVFEKITL